MRTSILTAGIAGVLAIGGTGAAFAATGGNDHTATGVRATAVQQAAASKIISHARANQIAHKRVPGARITSGELKQRRTVWEINLLKARVRYEVDISARTGKVLRVDRDRHSDRAGDRHGGRSSVEDASFRTQPTADVRRLDSARDVQERGGVRHLDSPRDVQERATVRQPAPRQITVREDNPARQLDDNHRHGGRDDDNPGRHDNHNNRNDNNRGGDNHGGNSGRH